MSSGIRDEGKDTYVWDHRGRLVQVTSESKTFDYTHDTETGIRDTLTYVYDALDRRVAQTSVHDTWDGTTWSNQSQGATEKVYDPTGLSLGLVPGVGAKPWQIVRHTLQGPPVVGVLAYDQFASTVGGPQTSTVWTFKDPTGTQTSTAYVGATGAWEVSHQIYDGTGGLAGRSGATTRAALVSAPQIWQGMRREDGYAVDSAAGFYWAGTTIVDNGRYLSQSAADRNNPYRYAGNAPGSYNTPARPTTEFNPGAVTNWEKLRGTSADGRTWFDNYLLDPSTGFVTGYADAWTFGYTS